MKTNLLPHIRAHRGEYRMGRWFAGRIHIGTSTRGLVRILRKKINRHHRFGPEFKSARIALYAGAMMAHRQEHALIARFRL
jgi:hypothetical protein